MALLQRSAAEEVADVFVVLVLGLENGSERYIPKDPKYIKRNGLWAWFPTKKTFNHYLNISSTYLTLRIQVCPKISGLYLQSYDVGMRFRPLGMGLDS